MSQSFDATSLARMIDHTLLKPEATADDIDALCDEAVELGCIAVCVNGYWVERVSRRLDQSSVQTCAVAGFPLGAMSLPALENEISLAAAHGAHEVDTVLPVGLLRGPDPGELTAFLTKARAAAPSSQMKLILETALLQPDEITRSCIAAREAGFDFVKTSTGFSPAGGASVDAITTMHEAVGSSMGIKASGGIRATETALQMISAGATRLGTSSTRAILAGLE